ncbi:hypothetical protein EI94DRAFT_1748287 [Lactarius quietus]|nr:hypothetical protein EI94DRAFT_1748287 [Lactarius quietus]
MTCYCRISRVCDIALRSAANSGTKVTDEANARFKEATQVLSSHSERRHRLDLPLTVSSRLETAKQKDAYDVECVWSHAICEDEWEHTMTINFVLLLSPLLASRDPDTITRSSVPVHPFRKSFGTLAATMTVHVSPSSRTLTSICIALLMRVHIRLRFSATHFKART